MNDTFSHDRPDPNSSHPSGVAEIPVDVARSKATRIHPSPSERGVLETRTRPHACHSVLSCTPPIHRIPAEILLLIFRLATPSRTRDNLYVLLSLTHVCRFWRTSLVHYPRAWTTIFATGRDCRSFVEMCLERSQNLPLEVTMETRYSTWAPEGCDCSRDESREFLPNEKTPCEWHFGFESLAHPRNLKRIQALNTDFPNATSFRVLKSWNPEILSSPLPQLTTIIWKDKMGKYADPLFPDPLSLPNLRSATLEGRWTPSLIQVNNLISFTIDTMQWIDSEDFRLFASNNRSLESLELTFRIVGSTEGPPIDLLNLKSLKVHGSCPEVLSDVIHVPAFQHLSSLRISLGDGCSDRHTLCATGDGISLFVDCRALEGAKSWRRLTGYAQPSIRHVSIYDQQPVRMYPCSYYYMPITPLVMDAHTLDIGLTYSALWGENFWMDLQELEPQLKTIRFEVSEDMGPIAGPKECDWDDHVLDKIADLVEYRFKMGQPFSAVERMVVSEDERVNQLHDHTWRSFYEGRKIRDYLASV